MGLSGWSWSGNTLTLTDSELSQRLEELQNRMENSSAVIDASFEALKEDTLSNLEQLKSLKDAIAENLKRIKSNTNAAEALKAGS